MTDSTPSPWVIKALVPLYTGTIFLSALLLFMVQPMIGKLLLPVLGGVPSVWNTCMVFFQFTLLLGYLYSHKLASLKSTRSQVVIHAIMLATPWLVLPFVLPKLELLGQTPQHDPMTWLLLALSVMMALPFFAVSTSSPLLQRWFSTTSHPEARSPYFLYAASNVGSMLALLGYPLILEPLATLQTQSLIWTSLFGLLSLCLIGCGVMMLRSSPKSEHAPVIATAVKAPSWRRKARWILWAFLPSSLMLGVTTFLTSDLAAGPLLWVVPLALYLLTFILVFAKKPIHLNHTWTRIVCLLATFLMVTMVLGTMHPAWLILPCHLVVFFGAAMIAHGKLAKDAPEPEHLTQFFFWMSLGGVLGGAFNTFVAPAVFDRIWEYPLILALLCGIRSPRDEQPALNTRDALYVAVVFAVTASVVLGVEAVGWSTKPIAPILTFGLPALVCYHAVERPKRFAGALVAMMIAGGFFYQGLSGKVLDETRNFFGVLRVSDSPDGKDRVLLHGSTDHGRQRLNTRDKCIPKQYYHQQGPVADVMRVFRATMADNSSKQHVGVVGLGAGSMACYASDNQTWTFFEIDPDVVALAQNTTYFTFLKNSKAAQINHVIGDARLELGKVPPGHFDLLFIDAFSGDAIPMHLITVEAFELYTRTLSQQGMLALNVSNRFLTLGPVLATIAKTLGLEMRQKAQNRLTQKALSDGQTYSTWVVLGRGAELGSKFTSKEGWKKVQPGSAQPWRDQHQSLWDALF